MGSPRSCFGPVGCSNPGWPRKSLARSLAQPTPKTHWQWTHGAQWRRFRFSREFVMLPPSGFRFLNCRKLISIEMGPWWRIGQCKSRLLSETLLVEGSQRCEHPDRRYLMHSTTGPPYVRRQVPVVLLPASTATGLCRRKLKMRCFGNWSMPPPSTRISSTVTGETEANKSQFNSTGNSCTFLDIMEHFSDKVKKNPRNRANIDLPTSEQLFQVQQLCGETATRRRPRVMTSNDRVLLGTGDMSQAVISYGEVERLMPGVGELDAVSTRLVTATERISGLLATSQMMGWKTPMSSPLFWSTNARTGQFSNFHDASLGLKDFATFQIEAAVDKTTKTVDLSKWKFSQPELVRGVLGLWLYTLERRKAALLSFIPLLHEVDGQGQLIKGLTSLKLSVDDRCMRVIASTHGAQSKELRAWLDEHRAGFIWRPDGTRRIIAPNDMSQFFGPIFGLYVSSMSR